MEPIRPMKPMQPMPGGDAWWPNDLRQPSSSGMQDGVRYAFFTEKRRLLIDQDGTLTTYDSGGHRFSGVLQDASQDGSLKLRDLRQVR